MLSRITISWSYSNAIMLMLMAMLAMVALATLGVFASTASAQVEEEKSNLCHRTGSEENPFLVIEVDGSSIPGAHSGHEDFILGPASEFEGMTEEELEEECAQADASTGAADDQYGGDDVIDGTIPKKPLPNTGGVPLLGLAVCALTLVGVGYSVLRTSIRRDP